MASVYSSSFHFALRVVDSAKAVQQQLTQSMFMFGRSSEEAKSESIRL